MVKIADLTSGFQPISLEQMKDIRLMNRVDTKYVTNTAALARVLSLAESEYYMQQTDGIRSSHYTTDYFDTDDLNMYNIHHAGRATREKIRVRSYADFGLSFFEIKKKNNKKKTSKKRIPVTAGYDVEQQDISDFMAKHSRYASQRISPSISNDFYRLTLVNHGRTERVTIDYDLKFFNHRTGVKRELTDIVIVEVKRDGNTFSPIRDILRQCRVMPVSISKYCIGQVITDRNLKRNRFKAKLKMMDKLTNYNYEFTI